MKTWLAGLVFLLVISSGCSKNESIKSSNQAPTTSRCRWVKETDFTKPISPSEQVEDDYFADAVFIGDSRAVGVLDYEVFQQTDVLASIGLSINQWKIKKVIAQVDSQEKITVWDALNLKKYEKIYLIVGYNELGWGYSSVFKQRLQDLIHEIKSNQPQADLILELIYPISEQAYKKEKETTDDRIVEYNAILMQIAQEEEIYYLDLSSEVSVLRQSDTPSHQEQWVLNPELTDDGVHLNEKGFLIWKNYITTHTVRGEDNEKMVCDVDC